MTETPQPTSEPEAKSAFEERLDTKPQKPGLLHRIAAVWKDEYDTAVNWPRGRRHLVQRSLAILVVDVIALLLVSEFMNGIRFMGNAWEVVGAAVLLTLVAGLVTFLIRPVVFIALGINNVVVTGILTILFVGLDSFVLDEHFSMDD